MTVLSVVFVGHNTTGSVKVVDACSWCNVSSAHSDALILVCSYIAFFVSLTILNSVPDERKFAFAIIMEQNRRHRNSMLDRRVWRIRHWKQFTGLVQDNTDGQLELALSYSSYCKDCSVLPMQEERVAVSFQNWENKAEDNIIAEQNTAGNVSVPIEDIIVPETGSEVVAAYQPPIVSPLLSHISIASQLRVGSPTLQLQTESAVTKRPPVSLVADKYMILHELEGSSLNVCINIHTKEDFVCKVSYWYSDVGYVVLVLGHDECDLLSCFYHTTCLINSSRIRLLHYWGIPLILFFYALIRCYL